MEPMGFTPLHFLSDTHSLEITIGGNVKKSSLCASNYQRVTLGQSLTPSKPQFSSSAQ